MLLPIIQQVLYYCCQSYLCCMRYMSNQQSRGSAKAVLTMSLLQRFILLPIARDWRAYWELCKPRVVALMLLTALVGMQLATPGFIPWHPLIFGTLGIALMAGAAAAINHILDQHIDARMGRTKYRPLPANRLSRKQAIIFAITLAIVGMSVLMIWVNLLTAILTLCSLLGYAIVYTVYLKHATPQNIVIGGVAGAAPPLLGWTAVTGQCGPQAWLLVLIIFLWTPPHFWALAIYRYQDYMNADIPMLPNTHGIPYTKLQIVLYTCLMFAASILPFVIGMSGIVYFIGTLLLGMGFLYKSMQLYLRDDIQVALQTFKYSIFYLMMLFAFLLIDHYLQMLW